MGSLTKRQVYKYAQLPAMIGKQFEEKIADERAVRGLPKSNLVKKPSGT